MDTFYTAILKARFRPNIPLLLIIFGATIIVIAFGILILNFYPIFKTEIFYEISLRGNNLRPEIIPVDTNFGIVIPKIMANSKVIPNINPYSEPEYQRALTLGVAHAKGTVFPGEKGNIFIFSHSSVNFYEASRYNSIFYLLNKLEKEDKINLYYHGQKFVYSVIEKVTADPEDLSYLSRKTSRRTVTLMTCWPPGTSFKRLIVTGEQD